MPGFLKEDACQCRLYKKLLIESLHFHGTKIMEITESILAGMHGLCICNSLLNCFQFVQFGVSDVIIRIERITTESI